MFYPLYLVLLLRTTRATTGLAATLLLWPTISEQLHITWNIHHNLQTECPTAKTGLLGGGAFLSLDSALFWLVCLMLADNTRKDYFEETADLKGEPAVNYEPDSKDSIIDTLLTSGITGDPIGIPLSHLSSIYEIMIIGQIKRLILVWFYQTHGTARFFCRDALYSSEQNPEFYNWNRVRVKYCDGSFFTGDVEQVDAENKLFFRGARIFKAIMEDLWSKGMRNAENVDIPFKYLGFFLDDDKELDHIREEYGSGRTLTGEIKKRLVEVLTDLVERHRQARAAVTDEMVDAFMAVRPFPNMFN
ncbi:hypothetical protein K7X08_029114 [Anisodus acutangulus]|uniref:Pectin acetylesterase n=1 Tax=Anisodus acutangulus TaxID=402998 RepID=A0A9Q1QTH1_9SOLA|nr:hypothetical protein K7X08_029114 [Anisodus acutangulus]